MSKLTKEEERLKEKFFYTEEEYLKEKFFNTPVLFSETRTYKDFENYLFSIRYQKLGRLMRRKKKSKNFEKLQNEYNKMKKKVGVFSY